MSYNRLQVVRSTPIVSVGGVAKVTPSLGYCSRENRFFGKVTMLPNQASKKSSRERKIPQRQLKKLAKSQLITRGI